MPTEDFYVRPMSAADLSAAHAAVDDAFCELMARVRGDHTRPWFPPAFLATRFAREPEGCFVALRGDGEVVGALYSVTWGSLGWLGPLGVAPTMQGRGVAQRLLDACLRHWDSLDIRIQGLETCTAQAGHHYLYGKVGFRADWFSVGLRKALAKGPTASPSGPAAG